MENNKKYMRSERRKKLRKAFRGWYVWHSLVKNHDMKGEHKNTAVILLPQDDAENCFFALLYLDRMLSLRRFDAAILLTVSPLSDELISMFSEKVFSVESLSSDDADALLQYYELVEFDSRFIAASLDEPNGRNGRVLIGVSHITVEEMVAIGIYKIIPYVQKKRPIYHGKDPAIKKFMECVEPYSAKRTERVVQ